jgi:hypothetical protein
LLSKTGPDDIGLRVTVSCNTGRGPTVGRIRPSNVGWQRAVAFMPLGIGLLRADNGRRLPLPRQLIR